MICIREGFKLMKILEIKNNLVKISYDIDDNLALSGFVILEDTNYAYVAQVVSLKTDNALNLAIVKLMFTFDGEGVLKNHNGTIPSVNAAVSKLPANELLEVLPIETPVKLGVLAQQDFPLFVDKSIFENNLVVCCNKQENIDTFVNNMLSQLDGLNQKTVVIDVDGEFDYEYKFEFGYDFKLPLNSTALNYIFDNDLDDVAVESKAIIQDIFYEVQEYSKTTPLQFIPFETFIDVVDAQYRSTNIPELILLKNKLLKYKEENIFALNSAEITSLKHEINKNNITVLNISKAEGELQKQVISYIYNVMSEVNAAVYAFIKSDDYNSGKKLIKRFLQGGNIATTIICGHEFKYLQELKQTARNLILFAPLTLQHDFAAYNTYLNKLNPEEFIVFGDATQEIPLIAELQEFSPEDLQRETYYEEEEHLEPETDNLHEQNDTVTEDFDSALGYEEMAIGEETVSADDITELSEDIVHADNGATGTNQIEFEETPANIEGETPVEYSKLDFDEDITEETFIQDEGNETISSAQKIPAVSDIIEPFQSDLSTEQEETRADIVEEEIDLTAVDEDMRLTESSEFEIQSDIIETEFTEDTTPANPSEEIDEEQIVRDVDNILYNKKDIDEILPPLTEDDEITEDDLNLIDDMNKSLQDTAEHEIELNIEPVIVEDTDDEQFFSEAASEKTTEHENMKKEFSASKNEPPIVPIYPANDIPDAVPEVFEQGDQVTHPKYGTGVVEKMIKYGSKVLCSINFENIGRRLLDPAISEIKKV